jgi:hypothetical protein
MEKRDRHPFAALALWAVLAAGAAWAGSLVDSVRIQIKIPQGLKTEVTSSGLLRIGIENRLQAYNQPETSQPDLHQSSWKRTYDDTYIAVQNGTPRRIVRHTESDTKTGKNPETGKTKTEDNPTKGSTVTMTLLVGGAVSVNEDADPQVAEIYKAVRVGAFVADRELRAGEEWTLGEAEIKACLALIQNGFGKLKLTKVEPDADLRRPVADLDGTLNLTYAIPLAEGVVLPIKFDGTLKLRILVDTGLEILRKIDGKVSLDYRIEQGVVKVHTIGKGEYHEVTSTRVIPRAK